MQNKIEGLGGPWTSQKWSIRPPTASLIRARGSIGDLLRYFNCKKGQIVKKAKRWRTIALNCDISFDLDVFIKLGPSVRLKLIILFLTNDFISCKIIYGLKVKVITFLTNKRMRQSYKDTTFVKICISNLSLNIDSKFDGITRKYECYISILTRKCS